MVWKTLAAQLRTNSQLTYDPGRESNRGHLGERRALYAQANRATHYNGASQKSDHVRMFHQIVQNGKNCIQWETLKR